MNETTLKGVKQMCAMPFQNVSGGDVDIQSIICKNGTKDPTDGAFTMWWYDTTQKKYVYAQYCSYGVADDGNVNPPFNGTPYMDAWYWVTKDDDYFILVPEGWKHDPSALPTLSSHEKTFKAGEGFWILSSDKTPVITLSGQVVSPDPAEENVSVALSKGVKQMVANPFPVGDIDIQTILCKNDTKDPTDGAFSMWWYDTTQKKYVYAQYCSYGVADDGNVNPPFNGTPYMDAWYWVTKDDDYFILVPEGWKHDPSALPTLNSHEKKFNVGESAFVLSSDKTPFVLFKNPFYVAK